MLLTGAATKTVTSAEVNVPGQVSAPKYAHPGSFKPVSPGSVSGEQNSPVLDAEFTEVESSVDESGEKKVVRRRRRNSKGKGKGKGKRR